MINKIVWATMFGLAAICTALAGEALMWTREGRILCYILAMGPLGIGIVILISG